MDKLHVHVVIISKQQTETNVRTYRLVNERNKLRWVQIVACTAHIVQQY